MNLDGSFENLSDEEKEQAKEAASMEEIEEIAAGGGTELSLDELDEAASQASSTLKPGEVMVMFE